MLFLSGFAHRSILAQLVSRWMVNQPYPGDVRLLKRIVNFNSFAGRICIARLTREILQQLHGAKPAVHIVRTKGEIKDFVVAHPTYLNDRIERMRAHYQEFPEDYYRDTPIDGTSFVIATPAGPRFVGCTRIKRFRRIAEKGSRRIVDYMVQRIRQNAELLAKERARDLGVSIAELKTTPEEMVREFAHAERRVIKRIKRGTIHPELPIVAIPDVIGAKLIVESPEIPRLLATIESHPACRILEIEQHTGSYNAINLQIAYRLPKPLLLSSTPSNAYLQVLTFRGFDPRSVADEYRQWVESAEDEIHIEIIVSNFHEYLESEIGRSIHEERVLAQRSHPDYSGHLATNVRSLMNYVLTLCRSPSMADIVDVPIKLWVRYMPETIEQIIWQLFLEENVFFDTLPESPRVED